MISRHFKRSEFACKCGCGFDTVDAELLEALEDMRAWFNSPVTINSACRCPEHNAKEGGSRLSQHLFARAADVVVRDANPEMVWLYLIEKYPEHYGIGRYDTFTHIDTRNKRARW
jgi:uncharacterized protein YcbK (DUF882 family)